MGRGAKTLSESMLLCLRVRYVLFLRFVVVEVRLFGVDAGNPTFRNGVLIVCSCIIRVIILC